MSTAERLFDVQPPPSRRQCDFLAPERQQKFDLLLHLLANLPRLILLSGPDGIGKTTFLHQLKAEALPGWRVCLLEADERLNLETVQQALAQALGLREATEAALSAQLQRMGAANEVLVLALDEGGRLLPGVLDAIWRFAARHDALRMVVALRPDDLHVKGVTDRWAVEEAHVIDIPPLSEDQTRTFVCRLWTRLGRQEPDEGLVRAVYGRSHGIPARVRQEALERIGRPPVRWHRAMAKPVYVALGVVLSLVVALTYWQQRKPVATETETGGKGAEETVVTEPAPRQAVPQLPAPVTPIPETDSPGTEKDIGQAAPETGSPVEEMTAGQVTAPVADDTPAEPGGQRDDAVLKAEAVVETPAAGPGDSEPVASKTLPEALGIKDARWLLEQDPRYFTWQIGAFDDAQELVEFARRYRQLRPLAYYRKRRQGRQWYSLLFGVYPTVKDARQALARLPAEIGRPWLRRLRSVHKEIRAARSFSQP